MQRTYIQDLSKYKSQEVIIKGWVDVRRDQGKMVFFDIRDTTGKVQCVVLPNQSKRVFLDTRDTTGKVRCVVLPVKANIDTDVSAMEIAQKLRSEWVVQIKGKVNVK